MKTGSGSERHTNLWTVFDSSKPPENLTEGLR